MVTEGVVGEISVTQNGGHLTISLENLSIFVPAQIAEGLQVQQGDLIRVYGVVQTYHGKKEIILGSKDDIRIIPELTGKKCRVRMNMGPIKIDQDFPA